MSRLDGLDRFLCATGKGPRRRPAGFTLVELLVVVSMLALVAAILVPSLNLAFELAYSTICRNNLHKLGQTMYGNSVDKPLALPGPEAWMSYAIEYGSRELLYCPKDKDRKPTAADLSDIYILQYNHAHQWEVASVQMIVGWMQGGSASIDPGSQIWVMSQRPESGGIHPFWQLVPCNVSRRPNLCSCWLPEPSTLKPNEYVVLVYDDCGIKVVFENELITIYSIDGEKDGVPNPGGGFYCNSSHYLVKGKITTLDNGKSDPEEGAPGVKLIQRLTGLNYVNIVDPPVRLGAAATSYGMNGLIEPDRHGRQQLMLMDADRPEITVGQWDWQDHIIPRHLGKVNVVWVDGTVHSMTYSRLMDEYLLLREEGRGSRSLWWRNACPGPR